MNAQRTAKVDFPTAGSVPSINHVQVVGYPHRHQGVISCSQTTKREEVKRLLGYARHNEGIETIDIDVVVRFSDPDFNGQSYGLALALADKRARCDEQGNYNRIIATGIVGNQGKISRVEAFQEKLALVMPLLDDKSLFLFPRENLDAVPKALEEWAIVTGTWRAVSHLDELHNLWQTDVPVSTVQAVGNRWRVFLKGLMWGFGLVMLAASIIALYWPN